MANAAQNDLRDKRKLESQLESDLFAYFARILVAVKESMEAGVRLNVIARFDEELTQILMKHYLRVERPFSTRIRNVLPKDVTSTTAEDNLINRALNHMNQTRSRLQATNINRTTQQNVNEGIRLAQSFDTDVHVLVDGRMVNKKAGLIGFELIVTATRIIKRKIWMRVSTIANTETQTPAEASKLTETEVLSGILPSLLAGTSRPSTVVKIWVSMGDGVTRSSHLRADGQERKTNKPFTVNGYSLLMPGDSSLGAPAKETVNCRCAAVYDDREVVAIRRRSNIDGIESSIEVGTL